MADYNEEITDEDFQLDALLEYHLNEQDDDDDLLVDPDEDIDEDALYKSISDKVISDEFEKIYNAGFIGSNNESPKGVIPETLNLPTGAIKILSEPTIHKTRGGGLRRSLSSDGIRRGGTRRGGKKRDVLQQQKQHSPDEPAIGLKRTQSLKVDRVLRRASNQFTGGSLRSKDGPPSRGVARTRSNMSESSDTLSVGDLSIGTMSIRSIVTFRNKRDGDCNHHHIHHHDDDISANSDSSDSSVYIDDDDDYNYDEKSSSSESISIGSMHSKILFEMDAMHFGEPTTTTQDRLVASMPNIRHDRQNATKPTRKHEIVEV